MEKRMAIAAATALILSACSSPQQQQSTAEEGPRHSSAQEIAQQAWSKKAAPMEAILSAEVSGLNGLRVFFTDSAATVDEGFYFSLTESGALATSSDLAAASSVGAAYGWWPPSAGAQMLEYPFGERLVFSESDRHCQAGEIRSLTLSPRSAMALLRIELRTDSLPDIASDLAVSSSQLPMSGIFDPSTGKWSSVSFGGTATAAVKSAPMASSSAYDFYFPPTPENIDVRINLTVNGTPHTIESMLPPMPSSSMTKLRIEKRKGKVAITGSWVSSTHPLSCASPPSVTALEDSIRIGNFLRSDGLVVEQKDSLCYAVVVETDGRHGRAAALEDTLEEATWAEAAHYPMETYSTIDGLRSEGILGKPSSEASEETVVFTPRLRYPEGSAMSAPTGAASFLALVQTFNDDGSQQPQSGSMLAAAASSDCAYIPSLRELALLYWLSSPMSGPAISGIDLPQGICISMTPSSQKNYYALDFRDGTISPSMSKSLSKNRLRLFYVF